MEPLHLLTLGLDAQGTPLCDWGRLGHNALLALVFVAIGLALFGLAFLIMTKVCPFSVRKELEEDQNVALGVLMGAVIIGIAIIIAAAIH